MAILPKRSSPRSAWRRASIRRGAGVDDATRVINKSYRNRRRNIFMADRNQNQSPGQQGGQQAGQQSGQQGGQQMQPGQPSAQQAGEMQARGQAQRGGGMARRGG